MAAPVSTQPPFSSRKRGSHLIAGKIPVSSCKEQKTYSPNKQNISLYLQVKRAFAEGRYHEAMGLLSRLERANYQGIGIDRKIHAIYLKGKLHVQKNQYQSGIERLTKALTLLSISDTLTDSDKKIKMQCHYYLGIAHTRRMAMHSFVDPYFSSKMVPSQADILKLQEDVSTSIKEAPCHLKHALADLKEKIQKEIAMPDGAPQRLLEMELDAKFAILEYHDCTNNIMEVIQHGLKLLGLIDSTGEERHPEFASSYEWVLEKVTKQVKLYPHKIDLFIEALLKISFNITLTQPGVIRTMLSCKTKFFDQAASDLSKRYPCSKRVKISVLSHKLAVLSHTPGHGWKGVPLPEQARRKPLLETLTKEASLFLTHREYEIEMPKIYLLLQVNQIFGLLLLEKFEEASLLLAQATPGILKHYAFHSIYKFYLRYTSLLMEEKEYAWAEKISLDALEKLKGKIRPSQELELRYQRAKAKYELNPDVGFSLLKELAKKPYQTPWQSYRLTFDLMTVYFEKKMYSEVIPLAIYFKTHTVNFFSRDYFLASYRLLISYFETGQKEQFMKGLLVALQVYRIPSATDDEILTLFTMYSEIVAEKDLEYFRSLLLDILENESLSEEVLFQIKQLAAATFDSCKKLLASEFYYYQCLASPLCIGSNKLKIHLKIALSSIKLNSLEKAKEHLKIITDTDIDSFQEEEKTSVQEIYQKAKDLLDGM